ncbi:uracil-DNA glycosylase family protein [Neptuniibacter sp.]|uniref:uracil-DNA glycosylase family protein n=1 Tax=Neptuniibacter sp. TaxID=1962643 RepID=UPI002612589E|nr:uracil-DNA glycosylase family protein [Neptuniibacter sp.]MCP4596749.1 uracil-DNA glycosylase family protein [Neptuniibacter sp.]
MEALIKEIKQCKLCEPHLPLGANPVFQISPTSKLLIIGQAPGTKVHQTSIPWNDPSGDRLRDWLEMDKEAFYNSENISIVPMGLCYPGKGRSGDLPPRPECAPQWHDIILKQLTQVQLILLIGQYSQQYYLKESGLTAQYKTLTERVKHFAECPGIFFPLPHPSPRNQIWLKKNPWFYKECLPALRERVQQALG